MKQDVPPAWRLDDDVDAMPMAARSPAAALTSNVRRVIRPGQPGTIKLQRRFGSALQAVRYRYDATGLYRYTTVELLVEQAPVTRGRSLQARFAVRIGFHEERLRAQVRQQGGKWHAAARVWILSGRAVQALNLAHRVDLTIDIAHGQAGRPATRRPQIT
jgi:hypothetical protein